jgi:lipopolysaccharide/colanic/teichoic acid biosynthesis glycosyltransferase
LKSEIKTIRLKLNGNKLKVADSAKAGELIFEEGHKTNYFLNNSVSFIVYIFTFFVFNYIKRSTFLLDDSYVTLFIFLIISLIIGSLLSNKFRLTTRHEISQIFRKLYISLIITLGSISILMILFDLTSISRYQLMGGMLSGFLLESVYYYLISERRKKISLVQKSKVSFNYMLTDVIVLSLSLYLFAIMHISEFRISEKHLMLVTALYISWLFSAAITHKFNPVDVAKTKLNAFGLQLKFYILIASLAGLSIYLLQLPENDISYFAAGVTIYFAFSFLLFIVLFAEKVNNKSDEVTSLFLNAFEMKGPAISSVVKKTSDKYKLRDAELMESTLKQKLKFDYLKDFVEIFDFLNRSIDLSSFDVRKSLIIRSADPYNVKVLPDSSHQLIINLHEINDIRKINHYFSQINRKLIKGGVFVGAVVPNKNRYKRFIKKYSFLAGNIISFLDFIWKRMFPKIPMTRKIYFTLSKGKDRAISLAESFGRLVYIGFEILDLTELDDIVYFAAVKAKEATTSQNPNYSPIFKMRRIGENGKIIYVYKFRTMHPYSEYIQDFIYKHNQLEEGGKFKDDFRIPGWGKLLRRFWIDELPMLFNWIKRELKFVGVRPISNQYLSLYSKEHQAFRKKFKPGLVPPFYADMPKTIEEIEKSERIYLESYQKQPFITDIKYLTRVILNILFRKKRSG